MRGCQATLPVGNANAQRTATTAANNQFLPMVAQQIDPGNPGTTLAQLLGQERLAREVIDKTPGSVGGKSVC